MPASQSDREDEKHLMLAQCLHAAGLPQESGATASLPGLLGEEH